MHTTADKSSAEHWYGVGLDFLQLCQGKRHNYVMTRRQHRSHGTVVIPYYAELAP